MADGRRRSDPSPAPPARRPDAPTFGRPVSERRVVAPPPSGIAAPRAPSVRVVTGPMFIDTASGTFEDRRAPPPPVLSRRAFEQELSRLTRAFGENEENPASVSCTGCRRCVSCMFCEGCEECYRCTHSRNCRTSSHLTQCADCDGCHDCAYCVRSENCTRSNYVVLCRSCSECTYCFGCVGLAKADFHILNVKYTRSEYFRIVKSLSAELGLD